MRKPLWGASVSCTPVGGFRVADTEMAQGIRADYYPAIGTFSCINNSFGKACQLSASSGAQISAFAVATSPHDASVFAPGRD